MGRFYDVEVHSHLVSHLTRYAPCSYPAKNNFAGAGYSRDVGTGAAEVMALASKATCDNHSCSEVLGAIFLRDSQMRTTGRKQVER